MSLQLFPFQGLMLTDVEIKLLKFANNRKTENLRKEQEKREERLLLTHSLQSNMLSGMQLELEERKFPSVNIAESAAAISLTTDELAQLNEDDIEFTPITDSKTCSIVDPSLELPTTCAGETYENRTNGYASDHPMTKKFSTLPTLQTKSANTSFVADSASASVSDPQVNSWKKDSQTINSDSPASAILESSVLTEDQVREDTVMQHSNQTSSKSIDNRIRKKQKIDPDDFTPTADVPLISHTVRTSVIKPGDDIFTPENTISVADWSPKLTTGPLRLLLPNFALDQNQTLALKLTVVPSGGRWSLNICPERDWDGFDVFMHFNPRYKTGDIIQNDMQGTWGGAVKKGMTGKATNLRSSSLQIIVQIRKEGFFTFANGNFITFFGHRREPFEQSALSLIVPDTDGMGHLEDVTVHKVWWGRIEEIALPVPAHVLAQHRAEPPLVDDRWTRTVCVMGLPPFTDPVEIYELEKALYSLFNDYVPELASVVTGKGRGYVRLPSTDAVTQAIEALNRSVLDIDGGYTLVMQDAVTANSSS